LVGMTQNFKSQADSKTLAPSAFIPQANKRGLISAPP
jgi:hypothetical protein